MEHHGAFTMRRSREEAAATRQRIVDTASHEFRENGIAGTGLSELMGAAGLTQGGFYKHFESKDQLVAEAIERSFDQVTGDFWAASIKGKSPDAAFRAIVDGYLSAKHRDHSAEGCPLSALGTELRRSGEQIAEVATEGMKQMIELIAEQLEAGVSPEQAKKRATAVLSAMVGGMVLARLANNVRLSGTILRDVKEFILQK